MLAATVYLIAQDQVILQERNRLDHILCCVPGIQRLFADVNGKFFPCERVSEESCLVNIGDCENGISAEKGKEILKIGNYGFLNFENIVKCVTELMEVNL